MDRKRLDFDFERICSVTMERSDLYICLTCGKYLKGRSTNTPAHNHSQQFEHSLYMDLESLKFFILPENEEFYHQDLEDVRYAARPTYSNEQIEALDLKSFDSSPADLHGRHFTRGFLGINNATSTNSNATNSDFITVCLHSIFHIKEIRNFLLSRPRQPAILATLGETACRYWNERPFKALVNPRELFNMINNSQRLLSFDSRLIDFFVGYFINVVL